MRLKRLADRVTCFAGIAAERAGMVDEGAMAETLSKEGREAGGPIAARPLRGMEVPAVRVEEEAGGEAVEMVRMADRGATARIYQLRTLPASIQAILMRALMEAMEKVLAFNRGQRVESPA